MKVQITGKNPLGIEDLIKSLGFEIVTENSETIISYGGDGTLLASERDYPGIPKLPIRDSRFCNKCSDHDNKTVLEALLQNRLELKEYKKLETTFFYKTLLALNDFAIRNTQPMHAIRFQTTPLDSKLLIGDGIVLSTPFGSTGYFRSITQQTFKAGFGLALNNTTEQIAPIFLKDEDQITFKLVRGIATLSLDNNPDIFNIDEGSEITFKLSSQTAKIYELESLRCPDCKVAR